MEISTSLSTHEVKELNICHVSDGVNIEGYLYSNDIKKLEINSTPANNATTKIKCFGNENVVIEDLGEIDSYNGEFPSPLQIINYILSKGDPYISYFYISDSTIRKWIKEAAQYHGIPHVMLSIILQQENAPNSSKWRQFLQFGERSLQTTAAIIDEILWVPDKIADGSSGFMNMRRPTLKGVIDYYKENYIKDIIPNDVRFRVFNLDTHTGIPGFDWKTDLYYGAAHIRELIDRVKGRCSDGKISLEDVEKIFISYNGSGLVAEKYGKDAINLLNNAVLKKQTLFFYEK